MGSARSLYPFCPNKALEIDPQDFQLCNISLPNNHSTTISQRRDGSEIVGKLWGLSHARHKWISATRLVIDNLSIKLGILLVAPNNTRNTFRN
jgi:hypothetical protein